MRSFWQALVNAGLLALALGACAGPDWQKPGASNEERKAALAECQGEARVATDQESRINQDIASSFHTDWQRTGVANTRRDLLQDRTREFGANIVERCMIAKGWIKGQDG
jgi:hypothetical protein